MMYGDGENYYIILRVADIGVSLSQKNFNIFSFYK